jgi:15-cis-phytoene synthase
MSSPATGAAPPPGIADARFFAWLFAPPAQRPAIATLFELEREILGSARATLDHAVGHARIGWWQEEADRLATVQPRHPLARALAEAFAAAGLSPPDLRTLLRVAEMELARSAFEAQPELDAHHADWSLAVFRNLALLVAPSEDQRGAVERLATQAGPAVREIERLCELATSARAGRICLPLDPQQADHAGWYAQPWDAGRAACVRERLKLRRSDLRNAIATLEAPARVALRAPLAWCAIAARRADAADRALPRQYAPGRATPLRETLLAWRAASAAARGKVPECLRSQ